MYTVNRELESEWAGAGPGAGLEQLPHAGVRDAGDAHRPRQPPDPQLPEAGPPLPRQPDPRCERACAHCRHPTAGVCQGTQVV